MLFLQKNLEDSYLISIFAPREQKGSARQKKRHAL